ncbi:hypothetical protein HK097_007714 [Rhizophlyctis rosea]|uniref:Uncharacterized protein n=1 Tax=Rhizophlyctis rosea TaxID=64517 RepID=A0AAD5SJB2_9FUNG|nr:hypothetical protein HK097_007714 [Rhizophlyctis rosea]
MTHIDLSESPKYIESLGTSSGYAWNEQFLVSPSASRYYRRRVLGDGGSGSGDVEKVFVDEILLE